MTIKEQKQLLAALQSLKLPGLTEAYRKQMQTEPEYADMPFDERLFLLVKTELELRAERKTERLVRAAKFANSGAQIREIAWDAGRTLNRNLLESLRGAAYVASGFNVILTGAAGTGKTYIACALGTDACAQGLRVRYARTFEMTRDLIAARAEGLQNEAAESVVKSDLLILDEFLLLRTGLEEIEVLFGVLTERYEKQRSTIFCSHYHPDGWSARLGGTPVAESLADRIQNRSYVLPIESKASMRRHFELPTPESSSEDNPASPEA